MLCEDVALFMNLLLDQIDALVLICRRYHLVDHVLIYGTHCLQSQHSLPCDDLWVLSGQLLQL